jgi:hypothetical protein
MELIPVAIHCVGLEGDSNPPQAHITVGIIERYNSDGSYVIKGLKQKIFVDGLVYLLQVWTRQRTIFLQNAHMYDY